MTTTVTKDKHGKNEYNVISKRPVRDTVINQEDITNLKIALETCKTLTEFLRWV